MIAAEDALKYAAAKLARTFDWASDVIGGSMCDHSHEDELGAISSDLAEVQQLAGAFGPDQDVYSNGRRVRTQAWVGDQEIFVEEIWHPDPTYGSPATWRGKLTSDPGQPSRGSYEVTTDPVAQTIAIRMLGAVP